SPPHSPSVYLSYFLSNHTPTTDIYPLSLHDALPISCPVSMFKTCGSPQATASRFPSGDTEIKACRPSALREVKSSLPVCMSKIRSEEHTSELQSLTNLVCRLLLEKKKTSTSQRELHL